VNFVRPAQSRLYQYPVIQANESTFEAIYNGVAIYVYYNGGASVMRATPSNSIYARRYLELTIPSSSQDGLVLYTQGATVATNETGLNTLDMIASTQAFLSSQAMSLIAIAYINDSTTVSSVGWYYQNGSLIAPLLPRSGNNYLYDLGPTNQTLPISQGSVPAIFRNPLSNGLTYVRWNFSNGFNVTQTLIPSAIYKRRLVPVDYQVTQGSISGKLSSLGPRINNVGPFVPRHTNPNSYVIFNPDKNGNFNASFYYQVPELKQQTWTTLEIEAEGNIYMKSSSVWNMVWYDQDAQYFNTNSGYLGYLSQAGKWNYYLSGWTNADPVLINPHFGTVAISIAVTNATSPLYVDLFTIRISVNNPHDNPHSPVLQ